jgi:hypothetical protein
VPPASVELATTATNDTVATGEELPPPTAND